MSKLLAELTSARHAAGMTHADLAARAGLNRMTVQRTEAGGDPRLSTLEVLARVLGMEIMLVPAALRPDLENFVRSGGRLLGQPVGIEAPASVVDALFDPEPAAKKRS